MHVQPSFEPRSVSKLRARSRVRCERMSGILGKQAMHEIAIHLALIVGMRHSSSNASPIRFSQGHLKSGQRKAVISGRLVT
jgi:hypothetical protein